MGDVIQFVPRNSVDRRPMLEQAALDVIEQISAPLDQLYDHNRRPGALNELFASDAPRCHDDIQGSGGSVLEAMYESSLSYVEGDQPA